MNVDEELRRSSYEPSARRLDELRPRVDRRAEALRRRRVATAGVLVGLVVVAGVVGASVLGASDDTDEVVASGDEHPGAEDRNELCGARVAESEDFGLHATVTLDHGVVGLPTDPSAVAGQLTLENTTAEDMVLVGTDADVHLIEDGHVATTSGRIRSTIGSHLRIPAGEQLAVPVRWATRRCDDDRQLTDLPSNAELRAVFVVSASVDTSWSMSEPVTP